MTKAVESKKTKKHRDRNPSGIRVAGLTKTYQDGTRTLEVLKGVDLDIPGGVFATIAGSSGSGKSTLLHCIGALDRPTSGKVSLGGVDYGSLSERALAEIRTRRVGFVFQFHHLLPEFTALENVMLPGMIANMGQPALEQRAEELLRRVGLGERMLHRPAKLSGGEQQRVAIARALVNDPDLVLADEPTGNLDQATSREVLDFLIEATSDEGKTLIMVTHDMELTKRAQRRYVLDAGSLREA